MASVNKVILVGNVGRDPETRYAPNGDAICNLSLATSDSWRDKATGEKKEAVEWHKVGFFGKLAEIVAEYVRKGSSIYVEGSIHTRKWQDKDGNDRYTTEIRGNLMQMLGGRGDGSGGAQGRESRQDDQPADERPRRAPATPPAASSGSGGGFGGMDDDIPFAPIDRRILYII